MYFEIYATSSFGGRAAIYKAVEEILVLRDEGNHDNLAGNGKVCDFEGLTVAQAQDKINTLMSEPVGHDFDGCHACTWQIFIKKLDEKNVPPHLTYNEPSEVFAIREALKKWRG